MNIAEELRDRVDFQIIAVDNGMDLDKEHKVHEQLLSISRGHPWLEALRYDEKLSHWQAKNFAVQHSDGDILWFCDAHCLVSRDALYNMFKFYEQHYMELNGTLHLPLTYHIVEYHKLIYKLFTDIPAGIVHYQFSGYINANGPYKVPCMSTCGMMMHRHIYDQLGGWPVELGIYGGGEHFINFTLAVLGYTVNIMPGHPLRHHGDKRGYNWNYDDYHRNRMIATYMFGDEEWLRRYQMSMKGKEEVKQRIADDVINTCKNHRNSVREKEIISIEEWIYSWTGN